MSSSDIQSGEGLKSEWSYLYKLLKSQPIAYDRIDAYLNILEEQGSDQKRTSNRVKKSQG